MIRTLAIVTVLALASDALASDARELAASASFTPGVLRATDGGEAGHGFVDVASDFDGSTSSVRVSGLGEVQLGWRLRAAVRVLDVFSDKPRPGVGAGIRWLDGAVTSTAYLFYKTEGFTEPEGELEAVLAFAHAFGDVHATANLAYGQDPEGRERDAEAALVGHAEVVRGWFVGASARYRDALGSTKEAVVRDGFAGPTTTLALGAFALSANAGVAMVETHTSPRKYGPAASLSLGLAF